MISALRATTPLHRPIADCGCLNYGLTRRNCRPWATIFVSAKDVELGKATSHEVGTPVSMWVATVRSRFRRYQCAPQNNSRSIERICQPSIFCSTPLSVLKRCLTRTLSQQCAGHDVFGNSFGEVPKLKCTPDPQIEDMVLQLPTNNHPIKPFDVKAFEEV